MIRSGNFAGAAETVKTANALANVCGRVCPQEEFCQSVCTRGKQDSPIAIRELHWFATQRERQHGYSPVQSSAVNGRNVAIIGAGPAGLACAFELAKYGHHVHVFDRTRPGGVPRLSIPEFRLSQDALESDVEFLSRFFRFHQEEVDSRRFKEIRSSYSAAFLAVGLGIDKPLPIPGSALTGVIPVLKFLETAKTAAVPGMSGQKVIVVGGGNVSLDAAATAKRAGAVSVRLLYRRSEQEMRVWKGELNEARRQGVEILFQTTPVEMLGIRAVEAVRCHRTRLSEQLDASGRRTPVDVEGSDFTLEAGTVIVAIGQNPAAEFLSLFDRTPGGYIRVNEEMCTSVPGIFAGGDLVGGEGTIVQSVAQGKRASREMHAYVSR